MHILIVADGRSPITRRWVQGLMKLDHKVTLISTFPCAHIAGTQATHVLPVAFSRLAGSQAGNGNGSSQKPGKMKQLVSRYRATFQEIRYRLAPLTLQYFGRQFKNLVSSYQPDIVHALRLPFEGMLASYTPKNIPLVVSIWGNDLTLHSSRTPAMQRWTRRVLKRADGLIADVRRDLRLSRQWGFDPDSPTLVVPTSGGVDLLEIRRTQQLSETTLPVDLPDDRLLIVNPRGLRPSYVRNDIFFQSIPLVAQKNPQVYYLCPSMAGQSEAIYWVEKLGIQDYVGLLPYLNQTQLWELFFRCRVSISLTIHDGTPNTLLEAMACDTFPIVGDIESLREWITPGVNGLLVDPDSPAMLADATLLATGSEKLRAQAAEKNLALIRERAEDNLVQSQLQVFYQQVLAERNR